MIHRVVQFALRQRFMVLTLTLFVVAAGALSFQRMPVDAYPDLSPPMVELITQWPGHASEEVERLVTLPLEFAMNGVPNMVVMRSITLYGLSDVRLTFEDNVDPYFARQVVFERLSDAQLPSGVMPSLAPLFSPSGLVYRYVLESPDRSPQELKTFEDWVIERAYRQVPGVADDSGFGGTTMQYQVLLDPARIYSYHVSVAQVLAALSANNSNAGGGSIRKADSSTTSAASVWCKPPKTSEMLWSAAITACPCAFAMSAKSRLATLRAWASSVFRKMTTRWKA